MMKNRIISLLLILVLSLTSAPFVFAEESVDSKIYEEDMKIMSALGFMKKISTDDENTAVTKGTFAASIMDLLAIKYTGEELVSPFSDVTSATLYYNEICLAARYGVAHGDETPNFEPDATVTYKDAAVMLVNALGYHDYAVYNGGYPNGYLKMASEIGLNKDLSVGENTRLSAGMCARMLLNAGEAEMVKIIPYMDSYKVEKGGSLFWEKHEISMGTGIVNANEYTSIDSSDGVGKNQIKIGDMVASIYYSNESTDYLGYNVEYYYRNNEDGTTVLYMSPKKTDVVVIDRSDINSYANGVISYNQGERSKKLEISKDVLVIYNGVYTIDYFLDDGTSIFLPENGEIKGIDNDNDGDAEIVSVLHYKNIVVSAIDIVNGIIYDKYDSENSLDFGAAEEDSAHSWIVTNPNGIIVEFKDLKVGDIVSVAKSMDGSLLRGVVSTNTSTGTLLNIRSVDDRTEITVNGTVYKLSSEAVKENLSSIGSNVILYLDFMGKVAHAVPQTSAAAGYAFVMKKFFDEVENEFYLKLLTADGVKADYKIAKTLRADGETYKNTGLNKYMESFGDYQVIICKFNAEGHISTIDTVAKDKGGDFDNLRSFQDAPTSMAYYSAVGSFAELMMTNAETIIFKTPDSGAYKNDYSLYSVSSLPNVTSQNLTVRGYCSDPESVIADCIHYVSGGSGELSISSPYMLISDIEETVNADDEPIRMLTGYNASANPVSYSISQNFIKSASDDSTIDLEGVKNLKVGDVIKYTLDGNNEIIEISPLHIMGDVGLKSTKYQGWFSHSAFWAYMGWLLIREDKVFAYVNDESKLANEDMKPDALIKVSDATKIYYVSEKKKTTIDVINVNNLGSITDYRNSRQKHQVLTIAGGGPAKVMVIYE